MSSEFGSMLLLLGQCSCPRRAWIEAPGVCCFQQIQLCLSSPFAMRIASQRDLKNILYYHYSVKITFVVTLTDLKSYVLHFQMPLGDNLRLTFQI